MRDEFLRRQEIWNQQMALQPGFLSVTVGVHFEQKDWVQISIAFDTPESLDRFMSERHDEIFAQTQVQETMENVEVEYFEVCQSSFQASSSADE